MAEQSPRVLHPWNTTEEVAAYLGVAPMTVRAWRKKGVGPAGVKMASLVRYSAAAVRAYERDGEREERQRLAAMARPA